MSEYMGLLALMDAAQAGSSRPTLTTDEAAAFVGSGLSRVTPVGLGSARRDGAQLLACRNGAGDQLLLLLGCRAGGGWSLTHLGSAVAAPPVVH